jgi:oxygen-independent coproporphyrinogen-3 oxidase
VTEHAALYVHIPFCETKCPYCDFNSFAVEGCDIDSYLDALRREMDARGVPRRPSTVFIGGGTPTVVEPKQLDRYLSDILGRIDADPQRELTVEANPGSLTREKVAVLRAHGVNRVSLGAQALQPHHLRTLGRVHEVEHVEEALGFVREGGIERVSLDFIYAIPGMRRPEWMATLNRVLEWDPGHLSCYALIYEAGTEFALRRRQGSLSPLAEEDELFMFRWTERRLRAAGYERYEISNFARPGEECQHNLNYWRNGSYAGFGAGAYSFLEGERAGNERRLERYASLVKSGGHAIVSRERLPAEKAARESVALALRMAEGVDIAEIGRRYGVDASELFDRPVRALAGAGLVRAGTPLRLARRGWRVADSVASEFL